MVGARRKRPRLRRPGAETAGKARKGESDGVNMRWFYISFIFLFAALFNHTVLPGVVPKAWEQDMAFWVVVFSTDVVFMIGACAFLVASFLSGSAKGGEDGRAPE